MQYKETEMLSKSHKNYMTYVRLDELPTNFRSYPKGIGIYTRRLNMMETMAISESQLNDKNIFKTLARLYEDVIISDNKDFTLYDLELVDFQLAVAVSSIWSKTDYSWKLVKQCPVIGCDNVIVKTITLDDFNFTDPVTEINIPIKLGGENFFINPLKVGQLIQVQDKVEAAKKLGKTLYQGILEFAYMADPENKEKFKTVEEVYEHLCLIPDYEYMQLKQIDKDITIVNYPFEVKCPKCGTIVKVNKQFNSLKAYL